jgi:phage-related protein
MAVILYNEANIVNKITPMVVYDFDWAGVRELTDATIDKVVRITNNSNDDGTNMSFNSITYNYVGVTSEGIFSDLSGEYSTPELTIDRQRFEALTDYITVENYWTDNLGNTTDTPWVGVVVTRRKISASNLYLEAFNDLNGSVERYVVENVLEKTKTTIRLKLTVSLAIDADNILDRKLSSGFCTLRYRIPKADGINATGSISTVAGGAITALTLSNAGAAYPDGTHPIKITTSTGSSGVLTATASGGIITTLNIGTAGTGYTTGDALTIGAPFHYITQSDGGCPYGQDTTTVDGISYFNQAGTVVTDFKSDYCGKRIASCLGRFDPSSAGNALPFYGTLKAGTKKTETT